MLKGGRVEREVAHDRQACEQPAVARSVNKREQHESGEEHVELGYDVGGGHAGVERGRVRPHEHLPAGAEDEPMSLVAAQHGADASFVKKGEKAHEEKEDPTMFNPTLPQAR